MVQQYRKQLSNKSRLQSSLGGQKPVGNVKANQLIMAKVMKVNYLYNTVEVITIHNREMLVKQDDTRGQFSARMPVVFGGSYANGQSYGQTIPINVGDQVLIGFMEEDKNAPVVIGVYKDASVAYELAPTNQVSGNPDTDTNTRKHVMEYLQLFPSQTYNWVDGEGGREATFQGRSFLKSAVGLYGSSRLNDYGYNYENLERIHLRGRDIEPVEPELPQIMFQHNATFASSATSVLFDDDGTFSLSKVNNNITNKNRSELRLDDPKSIYMRTQSNSRKHDDSSEHAEIGIKDNIPYIQVGASNLTLDDEKGLLLNGEQIQPSDYNDKIEELHKTLNELQNSLDDLSDVVEGKTAGTIKDLQDNISDLQDSLGNLSEDFAKSTESLNEYEKHLEQAQRDIKSNNDDIGTLNTRITNAAGDYSSLQSRLDTIEQLAKTSKKITDEVVSARKDSYSNYTYETLGKRLDDYSHTLSNFSDSISDLGTIRNNANLVPSLNDRVAEISNKINELTGSEGTSIDITFESIPYTTYSIIEQGSGTTTSLNARILRNGIDVTSQFTDSDIIWQRVSNDTSADTTWNNKHRTGILTLKIGEADVNTSSRFKATLSPRLTGGYKTVINETAVYLSPLSNTNLYIISTKGYMMTPTMTTTQLVAKLYQNGVEIDSGGTQYTYSWTAYDEKGTEQVSLRKTGKSISVSANSITSQSLTYKVEVSI